MLIFCIYANSTAVWCQETDFRIIDSDQNSYLIEFRLLQFHFEKISTIDSAGNSSAIFVPAFLNSIIQPVNGSPLLSQTGFSLILSESDNPQIRIVDYQVEKAGIYLPLHIDTLNLEIPAGSAMVQYGGVQKFKDIPLHSFQVKPFRYDIQNKQLTIFQKIVFRISVDNKLPPVIPSRNRSIPPGILALNANQVLFKPMTSGLLFKKQADNNWYQSGQDYLKIFTVEDGIYHITNSDLINSGIPVNQIDPQTFAMYYLGEQYPIYVYGAPDGRFDQSDYIEFFGKRNPGDGQYYNDYSDSSVYWLTWGGEPGKRIESRSVTPKQGDEVTTFFHRAHFEEDKEYYNGDNSLAIYNTDRSPGEGWIWKRIYAGDTFSFEILISEYTTSIRPDSLIVKLRGITNDVLNPDHHIELIINGNSIVDYRFEGVKEEIFKSEIPFGILQNGVNTISLRALGDTGAQYDVVYFDWINLIYTRLLSAAGDQINFVNNVTQQPVTYQVSDFNRDSIIGFDVTKMFKLSDFDIHFLNNKYSINFSDSVDSETRYFFVTSGSVSKPVRMLLDISSDLKNGNNQADYLIITHQKFIEPAIELANFRLLTQGLKPFVVDIQDIYDEFNFGLIDPLAIRSFITHTIQNWQQPSPVYLVLFGDATWDFKKNAYNSVKENFVPAYGNPVSDNRLVSIDGNGDFLPDLYVGRLPVETVEQAEEVIEKIKEYHTSPAAPWQKNVIFLNGGFDEQEQSTFKQYSDSQIRNFVEPPPFVGNPVRIYAGEGDKGDLRPNIKSAIDTGALWISFAGHGAVNTWDLMFVNGDIPLLENSGKLLFINSMTCHTARFANPLNTSFGEVFLTTPDRGAIAFWGSTGWGYVFQDKVLTDKLFQLVLSENVVNLGEATTLTKLRFWALLGGSKININTIDQYVLLGDPAQNLKIPQKPDLFIDNKEIVFFPAEPSEEDSLLRTSVVVYNYGRAPNDSVDIKISLLNGENYQLSVTKRSRFDMSCYRNEYELNISLKNIVGNVQVYVELDPDNLIEEINEENNRAEQDLYIYSTSISISKPPNNAVIIDRQPVLQIYSPEILIKPSYYYFEIDTTVNFDSPFLISSIEIPEQPVVTGWRHPYDLDSGTYYWRCRTFDGTNYSLWLNSSFIIVDAGDSLGWWEKQGPDFVLPAESHLTDELGILKLTTDPLQLIYVEIQTAGFLDGDFCYLIVKHKGENTVYYGNRGHNVVVVDSSSGDILEARIDFDFDTWADPTSADRLADFIERQPVDAIIMIGIRDEGTAQINERAYLALESIGSIFCRQVGSRESWAIIGRKGANPGSVPEAWSPVDSGYVQVSDTLKVSLFQEGTYTSQEIGPATRWHRVDWEIELPTPETSYKLSIQTFNKKTKNWQIYREISDNGRSLTLDDLDADLFSKIKLEMNLYSADGLQSPAFSGWQVAYDFPPDLTTHPDLFNVVKDSVLEGIDLAIEIPIYNVGMVAADSVLLRFDLSNKNSGWDSIATGIIPLVEADDSVNFKIGLPTTGYIGHQKFRVSIDPANKWNELSETNNIYSKKIFIQPDSTRPDIKITFDDQTILSGDLVSQEPKIFIEVTDNSPLAINDTGMVILILNSMPIYYKQNQMLLEFQPQTENSSSGSGASVIYNPKLSSGEYQLEVIAKDATQNSNYFEINFSVETDFSLKNVLNVPNPFETETNFTYLLTQPADNVILSVFTVSGRLILRLENLPGATGFNYYLWDGFDADGDNLANGVYLYQIKAKVGDETVSEISKLIVMR